MLTVFFGSILPDADTIASRSRFWMVSTVTVVPGSPRRANAAAAPPRDHQHHDTIQNHFLRNTEPPLIRPSPRPSGRQANAIAAEHREHRGDDRCHAHIDGHQPPQISPRRLRAVAAASPTLSSHIHHSPNTSIVPNKRAGHVPSSNTRRMPGDVGRTRQRLVHVMHRRRDDLLQREHHRRMHRDRQRRPSIDTARHRSAPAPINPPPPAV